MWVITITGFFIVIYFMISITVTHFNVEYIDKASSENVSGFKIPNSETIDLRIHHRHHHQPV